MWEHTAALAVGFQPKIKFAKVDCTDPKSEQLCMEQHVQAYPTIILFSSVHGIHTHEFYHGDRTPEAFLLAVAKLRDTVRDPCNVVQFMLYHGVYPRGCGVVLVS